MAAPSPDIAILIKSHTRRCVVALLENHTLVSAARKGSGRRLSGEQPAVVGPVKGRAGVGFARWRDVAVAGDARRGDARVTAHDGTGECGERLVLAQGIGLVIAAVQLDAYAEIVAVFPPFISGGTGVPGAGGGRYVLFDVAVAQDEEVGGNAQVGDFVQIGMFVTLRGQGAEEECADVAVAVFLRRQADVVDDEQADVVRVGAVVVVRAGEGFGNVQPAVGVEVHGY